MINVKPNQLKKCIYLTLDEFKDIILDAFEMAIVERTSEGLDIYDNTNCVPYEKICDVLAQHFDVKEVTSFHSDHCKNNPGVWVCYKDGSEAQ